MTDAKTPTPAAVKISETLKAQSLPPAVQSTKLMPIWRPMARAEVQASWRKPRPERTTDE